MYRAKQEVALGIFSARARMVADRPIVNADDVANITNTKPILKPFINHWFL